MRFEFLYVFLAIAFSVAYYFIQKKKVFGKHEHSNVLIKGMNIDLVLNITFTVLCLLTLLTIDGVASGLEIKYAIDIFRFLLRTPQVTSKAMLWMNIAIYIGEVITMVVGAKISVRRKGHKNLKLEKILTSDCVVCAACTFLSTLELGFCFLTYL